MRLGVAIGSGGGGGSGSGYTDPLTTNGDTVVRSGGVTTRLAGGALDTLLTGAGAGAVPSYQPMPSAARSGAVQRWTFATSTGPGTPSNIGVGTWARTAASAGSGDRSLLAGTYMSRMVATAGAWVGWAVTLNTDCWTPVFVSAVIGTADVVDTAARIIGIVVTVDSTPNTSSWWTGSSPSTKGMGILSYAGGTWQVVVNDGGNLNTYDTGLACATSAGSGYTPVLRQNWDGTVTWEIWSTPTDSIVAPTLLGSGTRSGLTALPDLVASGTADMYASVGARSGGAVAEVVQVNNAEAALMPARGTW